ncbi:hypothetical protein PIB30_032011 [Stylosanthes scabra]|uniref:Uncharacterized protein n=1 Tax=Stylosanthes scabra TaxID=79078 RepID=A0ABU6WBS1_9FABA|nr:hypothetical protein [Stylosanthes scabra]
MVTDVQTQEMKNKEHKTSLKIYGRDYDTIIEDPEDTFNPEKIIFPFAVEEKLHCFVSPLMSKEEAENVKPFYPSIKQHELIIKEDMNIARFESSNRFQNDPLAQKIETSLNGSKD